MNLLVTGVGSANKGAELMLIAIKEHFAKIAPELRISVSQHAADFAWRSQRGLWQYVDVRKRGRSWLGMKLLPSSFRESFGLTTLADIDALVDASGFAFGDQHPAVRTSDFAKLVTACKNHGKKVILLPQSFGPFKRPELRQPMKTVLNHTDLICARDTPSYETLKELSPDHPGIRLAPDITIGVSQAHSPPQTEIGKSVLLVPNSRMLDRTSPEEAEIYLTRFTGWINLVRALNHEPKILLHDESEDPQLVERIQPRLKEPVVVIPPSDPLSLKNSLTQCRLVIGSRFHALLGALSQGVPAIGFGWSHKYQELFNDFGCPEMVVPLTTPDSELKMLFGKALSEDWRQPQIARQNTATERFKTQLRSLWDEVDSSLHSGEETRS